MKIELTAQNPEDSKRLAQVLTQFINRPALVLLEGDLGAGKTFLVKEFTKATGSNAQTNSPTFSIINLYDSPKGPIYHLDLYRISDIDELYSIGFDDILNEEAVIFIEWPQVAELDSPDYVINIKDLGNNQRKYLIESFNHDLSGLEDKFNE